MAAAAPGKYIGNVKPTKIPAGFKLSYTGSAAGSGGYRLTPIQKLPTPAAPVAATPKVDPYAPMTRAEIATNSAKQAQDAIDAQTKAITGQKSIYDADQERQRQAYVQLAQAAAEMAKGLGPAGQAAYNTGAEELKSIASPLSEQIKNDMISGETANRSFVNSQVAGADPSHAPDAGKMADVAYGLGATIPGSSLIEQGQNFAEWGAKQPGIIISQGADWLRGLDAQISTQDAQYRQQIADAVAKYPELQQAATDALNKWNLDVANYKLALRDAAVKERAQSLYEKQFGNTVKKTNATIKQAGTRLKIQQQSLNLQLKKHSEAVAAAEAKGRKIDAAGSKVIGHVIDQNGRPVLDKNGHMIPVNDPSSGGKDNVSRTSRAKAVTSASANAYKTAVDLRGNPIANKNQGILQKGQYIAAPGAKGADVYPGKAGGVPTTNNPAKAARDAEPLTFAQALDRTYAAIGGDELAASYGLTPAAVRKMVRQQLIRAGWKPDGKRP